MNELIAKRYTKALIDGSSKEDIDSLLVELKAVSTLFSDSKFNEIVASPFVSKADKLDIILSAINDSDKITNLVKVLAENGRLNLIPIVTDILDLELNKLNNNYIGTIYTDSELTEVEISDLEDKFGNKLNVNLKLTQEVCKENAIRVDVDSLGIEIGFSTEQLKSQMIDSILKAI